MTAGALMLIAGCILAFMKLWLYAALLGAGAFGCLMGAINFKNWNDKEYDDIRWIVKKITRKIFAEKQKAERNLDEYIERIYSIRSGATGENTRHYL